MLKGKNRGRHENSDLLAVGGGLESGADSDFSLTEADIAADESVHGAVALHVSLDRLCGLELVGGILVDEAGLQLVLHVGIGGEGVTLLRAATRIEAYQLARHVLHLRLGAFLHTHPCATAELAYLRRDTLLAAIFRELVESMDGDKNESVVLEKDLNHLLRAAVDVGLDETSEAAYAVVDVDDVVVYLNLVQFLD